MFLFFFLFCVQSINSGENLSVPFSGQKEITLYSASVLFGGLVKYLLKILDMFHLDILINLISNWPIINSQLMWLFVLLRKGWLLSPTATCQHINTSFCFSSACREAVIEGNPENFTEQLVSLPEKHIFTFFGKHSWVNIALYSRGRISVVAGHCSSSVCQGKR